MKINGKEYADLDISFTNVICDLEDLGIDIMSMSSDNFKPFSFCRGIISSYTGEKDLKECGRILAEHIKNGGSIEDILIPFTEAMESAGFGNPAEGKISPQDHKAPKKKVKEQSEKTE